MLDEQHLSHNLSISNYQPLRLAARVWLQRALLGTSLSPRRCLRLPRAPLGILLEKANELKFVSLLLPGRFF